VFTFGSNSNLLIPELAGAVVVADLDREDTNLVIREEIEQFRNVGNSKGDPSVAAMNCMSLIINTLVSHEVDVQTATINEIRTLLISEWKTTPQRVLFGNLAFTDTGEMIGSEHLSILEVSADDRDVSFIRHLSWPLAKSRNEETRIGLTAVCRRNVPTELVSGSEFDGVPFTGLPEDRIDSANGPRQNDAVGNKSTLLIS
jgi:hypothetical protein